MDAWINPLTGDYQRALASVKRDPAAGLANAVYLRLMTPLGTYWKDKNFGSRLHELAREKDLTRVSTLARQYSEQALEPLIKDGRAKEINVTASQPHDGRLLLLIEVTDAAGSRHTFEHPVKVM